MNSFPWGVSIGLGVVLFGTLCCIIYILLLDSIEETNSNVRIQSQKNRKDN